MERAALMERLVLNEICDDYENVDQIILPTVADVCLKLGLTVTRADIVDALHGLVRNGFVKGYILSSKEPFATELEGMPDVNQVEQNFVTYFYRTSKGLELQVSDDSWWPFDEEGNPI